MELILFCIVVGWLVAYRTAVGAYCVVTNKTPPWVQARQQRLAAKSPEAADAYAAQRSERTMRGFLGTLWGDLWEDIHAARAESRAERQAWRENGTPPVSLRVRLRTWWRALLPQAPEMDTLAADESAEQAEPNDHTDHTANLIDEAAKLPDPDLTDAPRGTECPDSPHGWHDRRTVETTKGRRRGCIFCRDGFGDARFVGSDARVLCPVHTPRGFCGIPVAFNNVNCGDHGPCTQSMTGQHETGAGSRACLHCGSPMPSAPEHAVEPYERDPEKVVVDAPEDTPDQSPAETAPPTEGEPLTTPAQNPSAPSMSEIANVQAVNQFGADIAGTHSTWGATLEAAEANIAAAGLNKDPKIMAELGRMREAAATLSGCGSSLQEVMKPHLALAEQVSGTANHGSKIEAYENQ